MFNKSTTNMNNIMSLNKFPEKIKKRFVMKNFPEDSYSIYLLMTRKKV